MDHDSFDSARRSARGRRRQRRVDARELFQEETQRRAGFADQRLCALAFEVLSPLLSGGLSDPDLADLRVESVSPAPDTRRLMVVLRLLTPGDAERLVAIRAALERVRGLARRELAQAIVRKRTPEVFFRLLAPEPEARRDSNGATGSLLPVPGINGTTAPSDLGSPGHWQQAASGTHSPPESPGTTDPGEVTP